MKYIRPVSALRFYDDYELIFEKYSDAEEALAHLHSSLGEYNLQLNAQKTRIYSLPMRLDHPWRDPIRRYQFGETDEAKQRALLGYFDLVFSLKEVHPTDPIVGYAISRLESVSLTTASWGILQDLLLQTMSVEPDSLQQVAVMFAIAYAEGHPINRDALQRGISLLFNRHAVQGHGSEVAWGLWMALSFSCTIRDSNAVRALGLMNDSAVALLALDAQDRGFLPGLDMSYWSTFMKSSELYQAHWLLSYEARVRNWLGTVGGGDHVMADGAFNFLRSAGVRFYRRVRAPTKQTTSAIPNWRPAYGESDLKVSED